MSAKAQHVKATGSGHAMATDGITMSMHARGAIDDDAMAGRTVTTVIEAQWHEEVAMSVVDVYLGAGSDVMTAVGSALSCGCDCADGA